MFQQPDTFRVHAGGGQVDDFGDTVLAVGAGCLDIGQVHVGTDMHAQRVGDAMHHLTDAEASGSGCEIEHADAHDHTGFRCDASFGNRLIPVAFNVLHIQRDGVGVEFADGGGSLELCAVFCFFFVLFAHSSFSTPCTEPRSPLPPAIANPRACSQTAVT